MTEYIVFVTGEHIETADEVGQSFSNGWKQVAEVTARSAKSAIRHVVENPSEGVTFLGGTFAAVPARSWQPVTVKTETKTQLRFS